METFGKQLAKARKAAHLTQDQLAEKVHVTRAAISHWENGRYVPDFDMIQALAQALDCRFDVNGQENKTENGESDNKADNLTVPEEGPEKKADNSATRKKSVLPLIIAVAIIISAAVLIIIFSHPFGQPESPKEFISNTEKGVRYRIEDYQAVTPREEGKPYLTINTESRVEHGENRDFWMYSFILIEDQGKPIHLQQIVQVVFSADRAFPQVFPESELATYQIGPDIDANQSCVFTGGLPMDQKDMYGIGLMVYAKDEAGERMVFTAYIPFPGKQ